MIFRTLKFIVTHPLNRDRKILALTDWFRWQVGSRLLSGVVEVPFVDDSVLLVESGMTGATGNIYAGLAEFEEMSFLLHFLRAGDLFVDIGANVGVFTVLASKVTGAESIAIEALPATHVKLVKNISANDIVDVVEVFNCALGDKDGNISFTVGLDTMNHVVTGSDGNDEEKCSVPVRRLDDILNTRIPRLIKIDVEGYETPVIKGALKTLQDPHQQAVIVELNGCGSRYGFEDRKLHHHMVETGYCPVSYEPLKRKIKKLLEPNREGNTIYLKESVFDTICKRVKDAPRFHVKNKYV